MSLKYQNKGAKFKTPKVQNFTLKNWLYSMFRYYGWITGLSPLEILNIHRSSFVQWEQVQVQPQFTNIIRSQKETSTVRGTYIYRSNTGIRFSSNITKLDHRKGIEIKSCTITSNLTAYLHVIKHMSQALRNSPAVKMAKSYLQMVKLRRQAQVNSSNVFATNIWSLCYN